MAMDAMTSTTNRVEAHHISTFAKIIACSMDRVWRGVPVHVSKGTGNRCVFPPTAAFMSAGRSSACTRRAFFFGFGLFVGTAESPSISASLRAGSASGLAFQPPAFPAAVIATASASPWPGDRAARSSTWSGPVCQGLIRFITVSNALRW